VEECVAHRPNSKDGPIENLDAQGIHWASIASGRPSKLLHLPDRMAMASGPVKSNDRTVMSSVWPNLRAASAMDFAD